ncbi:large subunit ribosomal protein L4 [Mycoplasmoides fastidiosum]|uniref:Large ribosomal subunit protein uL4 n=1 Tax=Mycoplasmoides fastidiosum TaxID=92758 RepID=A0ABU0LY71_9BACT|nr:50S ribosomal protein L4 [Mycoplasmoides fastidiosum]MDQ0513633.1 large subunit ribosomal protein L4 [Mycoplasmoides fastidiosum]UUD37947.1 50S ribosomal protein L4 [Mycoplasmoides fastidiosum]
MKNFKITNSNGATVGELELSQQLLTAEEIHNQSLFDAVLLEQASVRQGTHSTKTKAEVSGTGKKPLAQKHTGNARQGSRRNPHFVGGGVVFGPKPGRNYRKSMNRQVYALAFLSAFSQTVNSQKLTLLTDDFHRDSLPSTKAVNDLLKTFNLTKQKVLFVVNDDNPNLFLAARNIKNLIVKTASSVSVRDLLNNKHVVMQLGGFQAIIRLRTNLEMKLNLFDANSQPATKGQ